ncbi:MAG: zinc metallopeptidase [Clostridia bacterium]|nr:zinc metallopeptidase [Clostridia bacterium]
MYFYLIYLVILLPFLAFAAWASAKVSTTYSKYDRVANSSHMTGYDTAVRLMQRRGVNDISVNRVNGSLTDHYNPTKKQVNLSMSTYGSASVASVAVAAHEVGHVMQKKTGYVPYKIRNVLVPITNIGSRLALPVIIVGILLSALVFATSETDYGEWLVYAGIAMYGLSTLFMLVTLPVEFNASRRAKKMLVEDGILTKEEVPAASKVLTAAALTYVASLLISLVYFLRFLFIILSLIRRDK